MFEFSATNGKGTRAHERMLVSEKMAILFLQAVGITLLQLCFALLWARHDTQSLALKYLSLWQHDSQWYAHILEYGYGMNRYPFLAPGNNMAHIGFFPGYPYLALFVRTISRLETKAAMLLASQLCAVGMWTYFLLILRRMKVQRGLQLAAVVALASFPSAFFLVAAYSESFFLFSLLGFLFWMTSGKKYGWWLAALHGFLMSSTRIVGIPLLIIPLLWMILESMPRPRIDKKMLFVSFATLASGLLFFLFCQSQLGSWNAYSEAQAIGWGVHPNYGALFDLNIYRVYFPAISWDGFVRSDDISRISIPLVLIAFFAMLFIELSPSVRTHRRRDVHFRVLCYVSASFLLFITISGLWSRDMISVIRYMLPVFMLLILCAVSLLSQRDFFRSALMKKFAVAVLALVLAISTFIQSGYIDLFSFGVWIA